MNPAIGLVLEGGEAEGRVYVFRPSVEVTVSRMEKDPEKLESLYKIGLQDAEQNYKSLTDWLQMG